MGFIFSKMKFVILVFIVLLFMITGCHDDTEELNSQSMEGNNDNFNEIADTTTAIIRAATGGTIQLPGGAILDIPPNALAEDTTITVSTPKGQDKTQPIHQFKFEPEGLIFSKTAYLKVPYDESFNQNFTLTAWQFSELMAEKVSATERARGDVMRLIEHDLENNTVTLALDHFTFVKIFYKVHDIAYLVVDIPPKYIKPGNLLFTMTDMTGGPSWYVGHVGVFTADNDVCSSNISDELIESTSTDDASISPSGVQLGQLREFKVENNHIYLGVMEPLEGELSDADRNGIVQYCRDNVGALYSSIGQGGQSGAEGKASFSCVGLAEAAYESVGKGLISAIDQFFVSSPADMYLASKPQSEIVVAAGDLVDITVAGVVVHPDSPYYSIGLDGYYCGSFPCQGAEAVTNLTMTAIMPSSATFRRQASRGSYRFLWQTTAADAGDVRVVTFEMTTQPTMTGLLGPVQLDTIQLSQNLTIKVAPCETSSCGDAVLDLGEQCDDGNNTDGDGCNRHCEIESGGSTPDVSYNVTPTGISAIHHYGISPCPQSIGAITIENTGDEVHDYQIAINDPLISVTPTAISAAPGERVDVNLEFICDPIGASGTLTVQGTSSGGHLLDLTTLPVNVSVTLN